MFGVNIIRVNIFKSTKETRSIKRNRINQIIWISSNVKNIRENNKTDRH